MSLAPRAVLVHRTTEYEELLARHGTHGQAAFFLTSRGQAHRGGRPAARTQQAGAGRCGGGRSAAVAPVPGGAPGSGPVPVRTRGRGGRRRPGRPGRQRRQVPLRPAGDRHRHRSRTQSGGPGPPPARRRGRAAARRRDAGRRGGRAHHGRGGGRRHPAAAGPQRDLPRSAGAPDGSLPARPGRCGLPAEPQASSGVLVGTGTGATGWLRSVWQERRSPLTLPGPTDSRLLWFVREAWPSPVTGTSLVAGELGRGQGLRLTVESDRVVVFGDGMEADALELTWGQTVRLGISPTSLRLTV